MPQHTETTPMESQCQRVSVSLPEFLENNARSWYRIIESRFTVSGISSSKMKFHHTLAGLPGSVIAQLPQEVLDAESYEDLKKEVLAFFEKTKPELFEKLMTKTSICGRPSVYLREMERLAQEIGAGEEIVRHKFLQALPESLAPVIASLKNTPLSQLGKAADELVPLVSKTH